MSSFLTRPCEAFSLFSCATSAAQLLELQLSSALPLALHDSLARRAPEQGGDVRLPPPPATLVCRRGVVVRLRVVGDRARARDEA
eukprot:CAMPEP_0183799128 /NCGR_PEP_ID=MMETSP0803_2-20130417/20787_2 /TAXON_ID=195967 /ORGANISM="Crustomastix stigmata, Strain CCMP3273" /LENGTH=84 /DNA_ID=CAMNT_0026043825 /DNA_START=9 /DNA_END=259 /DNA_ORIENTATION=-